MWRMRQGRLMKKADLITGFVLLVLSGYVIWESWMMPASATFGPGSGFLPLLAGDSDGGAGGDSALRRPGAAGRNPEREAPFPAGKPLLRVAAVMVGLGVYISLMEVLGFLLNTFLVRRLSDAGGGAGEVRR